MRLLGWVGCLPNLALMHVLPGKLAPQQGQGRASLGTDSADEEQENEDRHCPGAPGGHRHPGAT